MNKKILIGIMLAFLFIFSNNHIFYGYGTESIVEEILQDVKVSVKEYKATGSFYLTEGKEEIYQTIISEINNFIGQVEIYPENENEFKIFSDKAEYSGEITILPYKDEYKVTLSISICGENLTFDEKVELETKVRRFLSTLNSHVEYSLCVKSEIMNNTMDEVRDIVINNLSLCNAKNTDEVKMNNGYSIIGYTGLNNKRAILGKDIDFNCAIVKYSSGCYLIIGEPEITITY